MMQQVIVLVIVLAALAYLTTKAVRRIRNLGKSGGHSCGGCHSSREAVVLRIKKQHRESTSR